ncbi:MAG: hypothetical protein ACREU6_02635 [Steroidobacteraceae bacterium]
MKQIEVVIERDASRESQGTYLLDARLRIQGKVTEDQLRALEDIAHRCPIHRLMTGVTPRSPHASRAQAFDRGRPRPAWTPP